MSQRAQFCPFKHLSETEAASLPDDILNRGVDVGVAILLQSANERLLLTRRAASLRIFPNVWVPPGMIDTILTLTCSQRPEAYTVQAL